MKKYYLLTIPAIVLVVILSYVFLSDNSESVNKSVPKQILTQNGSPVIGNPSASITVVEWGEYQCTYCYKFHQSTKNDLIKDYVDSGKINFVFRDFPLNGPNSVLAAEASYCADDQGKYWEYHDEVYKNWAGENTGWVTRQSLEQFAKDVNLEIDQFNKCLDDKKYNQKVLSNEKFGKEASIRATPSFLIFDNNKIIKIEGNQPYSVFKRALDTF